MARTVADLKTESLIGFDSTTYGTYVDNWLKDAVEEIASRAGGTYNDVQNGSLAWSANAPSAGLLAAAQDHAIVPFSVQYTDSAGNANELQWISEEEFAELNPTAVFTGASGTTGTPIYYSIFALKMWLYPTPSSALTVNFMTLPDQSSSFSGAQGLGVSGFIEEWWSDAIVTYVRSKLFRYEDDFDMAAAWENAYERNLAKVAREFRSRRKHGEPPRQAEGMLGRGGW